MYGDLPTCESIPAEELPPIPDVAQNDCPFVATVNGQERIPFYFGKSQLIFQAPHVPSLEAIDINKLKELDKKATSEGIWFFIAITGSNLEVSFYFEDTGDGERFESEFNRVKEISSAVSIEPSATTAQSVAPLLAGQYSPVTVLPETPVESFTARVNGQDDVSFHIEGATIFFERDSGIEEIDVRHVRRGGKVRIQQRPSGIWFFFSGGNSRHIKICFRRGPRSGKNALRFQNTLRTAYTYSRSLKRVRQSRTLREEFAIQGRHQGPLTSDGGTI